MPGDMRMRATCGEPSNNDECSRHGRQMLWWQDPAHLQHLAYAYGNTKPAKYSGSWLDNDNPLLTAQSCIAWPCPTTLVHVQPQTSRGGSKARHSEPMLASEVPAACRVDLNEVWPAIEFDNLGEHISDDALAGLFAGRQTDADIEGASPGSQSDTSGSEMSIEKGRDGPFQSSSRCPSTCGMSAAKGTMSSSANAISHTRCKAQCRPAQSARSLRQA